MKARPRAPLEVIEPEFPLQFLIVAFDAPPQFANAHQGGQRRRRGQRGEVILRGRGLSARPLAQEPDLWAWAGAFGVTMGEMHADRGEARGLLSARAFAPRHATMAERRG